MMSKFTKSEKATIKKFLDETILMLQLTKVPALRDGALATLKKEGKDVPKDVEKFIERSGAIAEILETFVLKVMIPQVSN